MQLYLLQVNNIVYHNVCRAVAVRNKLYFLVSFNSLVIKQDRTVLVVIEQAHAENIGNHLECLN